ncbi:MAG TPA: hypothetical protein VGN40_13525 [Lelliottia sp.]|jgi:hypothetical protein
MIEKIIFIDDQEEVRDTYKRRLKRMFAGIAEVLTLPPSESIDLMLKELDKIDHKIMYIIDEDLTLTGDAEYTGAALIEKIRMTDRRIPIYILTSDVTKVVNNLGDIEFLIDKGEWNVSQNILAQRFLRHINTNLQIKSDNETRFDYLLSKSLAEPLSPEEKDEFNLLNSNRSKILSDESIITTADTQELQDKTQRLIEIKNMIERLDNE